MNEKTARLIRKYAEDTQANERELKRRWTEMSQAERFAFRREMSAQVGGGEASEAAAEDED